MTTSHLASWLDDRLDDVPAELGTAIRGLLSEEAPTDVRGFVDAAVEGFESVAAAAPGRPSAIELLAADALLTYAFEAAADPRLGGGPDLACALADEVGPAGRLGAHVNEQEVS